MTTQSDKALFETLPAFMISTRFQTACAAVPVDATLSLPMRKQLNAHGVVAILIGVLAGCGGGDSEGSALRVSFKVFRDGANINCADVTDIEKTQVSVRSGGGVVEVAGFPRDISCMDGAFDLKLADGEYIVEVTAFDSSNAEIYQATRTVSIPATEPLVFSLEPQKARLNLSWSFEMMDQLMPCTDEVGSVDVTISASGTSGDSFNAQFDCTGGGVWLDRYFNPRTYTVLIIGTSSEGYTLFKTRDTVVLERGENEIHAILNPEGGQISLDWQFKTSDGRLVSDCADMDVDLTEIQLEITTDFGDEPIMLKLECGNDQPYVLKFKRFTQGTALKFELLGDGAHRYRYYEEFLMPVGDKVFGLLTLNPVGDASIFWTKTATSGCNMQSNFEYELTVTHEESGINVLDESVGQTQSNIPIKDLPYGDYLVEIAGKNMQDTFCRASGTRVIDQRGDNAWAVFEL